MQERKTQVTATVAVLMLMLMSMLTGCDNEGNKRLAEMAERHLERQAVQTRQTTELQRQVAEGSRRLVEAGAEARREMVTLQREVQSERSEIGRQRDSLENERRDLATKRRLDPIIAAAITNIGLLLTCLLPLVICWYVLHPRIEPAKDQVVAETLLEDLVADRPLLLPRAKTQRAIGFHNDGGTQRLSGSRDRADKST